MIRSVDLVFESFASIEMDPCNHSSFGKEDERGITGAPTYCKL
jgi:hypothetical protein